MQASESGRGVKSIINFVKILHTTYFMSVVTNIHRLWIKPFHSQCQLL